MSKVKGYNHSLDECEYMNTEYFDECDKCGELTSCTCLYSVVDTYEIENTGNTGNFAYRYQYKVKPTDLIESFGYAESYRQAMDSIAHSVLCKENN